MILVIVFVTILTFISLYASIQLIYGTRNVSEKYKINFQY